MEANNKQKAKRSKVINLINNKLQQENHEEAAIGTNLTIISTQSKDMSTSIHSKDESNMKKTSSQTTSGSNPNESNLKTSFEYISDSVDSDNATDASCSKKMKGTYGCSCENRYPVSIIICKNVVQLRICAKCNKGILQIIHDSEREACIFCLDKKNPKAICACALKLKSDHVMQQVICERNPGLLRNMHTFQNLINKFPKDVISDTFERTIQNAEALIPFTWNDLVLMKLSD